MAGDAALGQRAQLTGELSAVPSGRGDHQPSRLGAQIVLQREEPLGKNAVEEIFESLARRPAATLLIDDERSLTENLAEAIETAGYDVVVSLLGRPLYEP